MFRSRHRLACPALFRLCRCGPLAPRFSLRSRCHPERTEGSAFLCPASSAHAAFQSFKSADVQPWRPSACTLSLFCKQIEKLNPRFSISSALVKKCISPTGFQSMISTLFCKTPAVTSFKPNYFLVPSALRTLSLAESALTKNARVTRLESALAKTRDLKRLCLHPRHARWFSRKTGEPQ